jgi:hypothetical protein
MRISAVSAAVLLSGVLGVTVRSDGTARPALDAESREYVRLAVALGARDPDSLDFYAGPADLVADARAHPPALAAIARSADAAIGRLQRHDAADRRARRQHLLRELAALEARVELLLGSRPPFDVESTALFGATPGAFDDARFAATRSRIAALVPPSPGRLVDRLAAYDTRFAVPADRVPIVFARALAECRTRTLAHVRLPAGEGVAVEYVDNRPWSAYSRYHGRGRSTVSINTGFQFTVDRLLQAACHEGYPGHHARNVLREAAHDGEPEFAVQPLFSPDTFVAEGAAMYAADITFSEAERIAFERDQLFPAAGIAGENAARYVRIARLVDDLQEVQVEIARQYLDGRLEFARAAAALEEQALMRETAPTLKYVNEFRTYITAYTTGRQAAIAFVDSCGGLTNRERRWGCYAQLLTGVDQGTR